MLSESQKNYIDLVLMGGEISEQELKDYLKSSGWSDSDILLGVSYNSQNKISDTTSQVQSRSLETKVDPYKETPINAIKSEDSLPPEFSRFSSATPITQNKIDVSTTPKPIDPISKTTPRTGMDGISPMMTMPTDAPKSSASGFLKIIAWFLFVVLVLMVAGLLGYMYYTNTGFFGNINYTKSSS